jgi:hypothetical protein
MGKWAQYYKRNEKRKRHVDHALFLLIAHASMTYRAGYDFTPTRGFDNQLFREEIIISNCIVIINDLSFFAGDTLLVMAMNKWLALKFNRCQRTFDVVHTHTYGEKVYSQVVHLFY